MTEAPETTDSTDAPGSAGRATAGSVQQARADAAPPARKPRKPRASATAAPRWLTDDDDGPRDTLTRARIVAAALELMHNEDLDALTMRRLASTLHVAPMSLYTHVADKRELIDLMVDHIIGEAREDVEVEGPWQQQVRSVVHAFHNAWARHGDFISVYSRGVTLGPNAVRLIEWLVKVLRDGGFSDRDAAYALYSLVEYVVGTLQFSPIRTAPGAQPAPDGQFHDRVSEYFVAVPLDEIPNIIAVDEHLNGDSFGFGLEVFIAGLEARLDRTRTTTADDC